MYHRVNELTCDPWQLAVSPAHFEEQLRVIQREWNPVSLTELTQSVLTGSVPDRSVALTFDDGYIDNYNQAKPLLEKYSIPATFFITTKNCERQRPFWWDELQTILLETAQLPEQMSLTVDGKKLDYTLKDEATLTALLGAKHRAWVADAAPPTERSAVYLALWQRLRPLTDGEQQRVMDQLRRLAGHTASIPPDLICMTPTHLRELVENPLFSLGAHSVSHAALADQSAARQRREIIGSKSYLEKLTNSPILCFAYPYGYYNDATLMAIGNAGFKISVATHAGTVTKQSDNLRLNRCQVNDWTGSEFSRWLCKQYYN